MFSETRGGKPSRRGIWGGLAMPFWSFDIRPEARNSTGIVWSYDGQKKQLSTGTAHLSEFRSINKCWFYTAPLSFLKPGEQTWITRFYLRFHLLQTGEVGCHGSIVISLRPNGPEGDVHARQ